MADGSKQSIVTKNRIQPLESEDEDNKRNYKPSHNSKFKEQVDQKISDDSTYQKANIQNSKETSTPNKPLIDNDNDDFVEVEHTVNRPNTNTFNRKSSNFKANNYELNSDPKMVSVGKNTSNL